MKRITIIAIVTVILCTFITGCSNTPKEVKEYKEWYEALQIENREGFKYLGSSHEDNRYSITIECDEENLGAFNDVIKRHNQFVKSNPDYFSEDAQIYILSSDGGPSPAACFDCYNRPGDYFGEISGQGIEENLEVQYMSVEVFDLITAYEKCQNSFSIPVLILTAHDPGHIFYEDFEFLKQFSDVEQIIIYFSELDYDMEEVAKAVHEYCPDAELYQTVYGPEYIKW